MAVVRQIELSWLCIRAEAKLPVHDSFNNFKKLITQRALFNFLHVFLGFGKTVYLYYHLEHFSDVESILRAFPPLREHYLVMNL